MSTHQPVVFLDPDGTAPVMGLVIVRYATGVVYQQQYGGTATLQGQVEGYLVPVDLRAARPILDGLFLDTLHGAGLGSPRRPNDQILSLLRRAVGLVRFWPSVSDAYVPASTLRLDEERAEEMDEGWLPIVCADGPGVLIWDNSD